MPNANRNAEEVVIPKKMFTLLLSPSDANEQDVYRITAGSLFDINNYNQTLPFLATHLWVVLDERTGQAITSREMIKHALRGSEFIVLVRPFKPLPTSLMYSSKEYINPRMVRSFTEHFE